MNKKILEKEMTLSEAVEKLTAMNEGRWEEWEPEARWNRVQGVFRSMLLHLNKVFPGADTLITDASTLERLEGVMALAGEAARHVDAYVQEAHLPLPSAMQSESYRKLQEFYRRKMVRSIDEALLSKWLLALTEQSRALEREEALSTTHFFVDLDAVRKDSEYELFFILKEDGGRFFNPKLIRSMKLIADFEFGKERLEGNDLFVEQVMWVDRWAQRSAYRLLSAIRPLLRRVYPLLMAHREDYLVATLHKAIMALMLAANPQMLIESGAIKHTSEYWGDMRIYLRDALSSREFQKLVLFTSSSSPYPEIIDLVSAWTRGLYFLPFTIDAVEPYIHYCFQEGRVLQSHEHRRDALERGTFSSRLACEQAALLKALKLHPNRHLEITLDQLVEQEPPFFDPYLQGHGAGKLYRLVGKESSVDVISLPSPTSQKTIQRAALIEEFAACLRSHRPTDGDWLLLNFQDRTSWKEHARAAVIEKLPHSGDFSPFLAVLTLPRDTEFYLQLPPYEEDHQAISFFAHLKGQLLDTHAGFHLSEQLEGGFQAAWIDNLIDIVHSSFFAQKNVLTREARRDFIEICYLLIAWKAIEITGAKKLFLSCKDGIDTAPVFATELYLFLKIVHGIPFLPQEESQLYTWLFGPAILLRGRAVGAMDFQRLIGVLRVIETAVAEKGSEYLLASLEKIYKTALPAPSVIKENSGNAGA